MFRKFALLSFVLTAVRGQQVGTNTAETHPPITIQQCNANKVCTTQQRSVVLDANWRWLHSTQNLTNCYTGNTWDTSLCSSPTTCAANCALDGADYSGTYGITTSGNALTMKLVTNGPFSKNIGGRVYLLENDNTYQLFKTVNQEFTFDVDVSQLPCGLNGALYFVSMPANGGLNVGNNKAGAKYGTGYCDSQCPHDIKFIQGEANILDWASSPNDTNAGKGRYGACCSEMDIWEANSMATAYTPHVCSSNTRCTSATQCGDGDQRYSGICDKDGCDFNSFRMGDKSFYGKGKTVNTNSKFTVVTQFLGSGSTLTEIRRLYVQNGRVIANSKTAVSGLSAYDSITTPFCTNAKTVFGDNNHFQTRGGLQKMGQELAAGMVLVLSIWDDHEARMLWLDSNYPLDKDASQPGVARGECATSSGVPAEVEAQFPNAQVIYSNIKYGPINSTYSGTA